MGRAISGADAAQELSAQHPARRRVIWKTVSRSTSPPAQDAAEAVANREEEFIYRGQPRFSACRAADA